MPMRSRSIATSSSGSASITVETVRGRARHTPFRRAGGGVARAVAAGGERAPEIAVAVSRAAEAVREHDHGRRPPRAALPVQTPVVGRPPRAALPVQTPVVGRRERPFGVERYLGLAAGFAGAWALGLGVRAGA